MARKRVLLVDDDADCRGVLRAILERQGIQVLEASDGLEAVRLAREREPDLVVMDIRMPGMTGLEACRALRSEAVLKKVPIIVLSGVMSRRQLDEIARLDGMTLYDEYVAKPFQYPALLARVKAWLEMEAGQGARGGAR